MNAETSLRKPRKSVFPRIAPKLVSPSGVEIYGWRARIPGDFNTEPVPMLQVTDATVFDYEHDLDHDRYDTTIWYTSERGKWTAKRMALELAETGVAVLYPFEGDIAYMVGARHQIIHISAQREQASDDRDEDDDE